MAQPTVLAATMAMGHTAAHSTERQPPQPHVLQQIANSNSNSNPHKATPLEEVVVVYETSRGVPLHHVCMGRPPLASKLGPPPPKLLTLQSTKCGAAGTAGAPEIILNNVLVVVVASRHSLQHKKRATVPAVLAMARTVGLRFCCNKHAKLMAGQTIGENAAEAPIVRYVVCPERFVLRSCLLGLLAVLVMIQPETRRRHGVEGARITDGSKQGQQGEQGSSMALQHWQEQLQHTP